MTEKNEKKNFVYKIPKNGSVAVDLLLDLETTSLFFSVWTNNTKNKVTWYVNSISPGSNNFVQLNSNKKEVRAGEEISFVFSTTEDILSFYYMILSRGQVVYSATEKQTTKTNKHSFKFTVTSSMTSSITAIAVYNSKSGEILADSVEVAVRLDLTNQITISTSSSQLDAGNELKINITTSDINSFIGLRIVDQSVLLLKSGNDITKNKLIEDLGKYSSTRPISDHWYMPSEWSRFDVFADMVVVTDGILTNYPISDYVWDLVRIPEFAEDGTVLLEDSMETTSMIPEKIPVRKNFPETWLWIDLISSSNDTFQLSVKAPDTITSWIMSCFSLSPTQGLAIIDPLKITVFRKFFITLNSPLKITRGEVVVIQATIFNYFTQKLLVKLTLHQNDRFQLVMPVDDVIVAGNERVFEIEAENSYSVWFPVRMSRAGDVTMLLTAESRLATDKLSRVLQVQPEGVRECDTSSMVLEGDENMRRFQVEFPDEVVADSKSLTLHLFGDMMSSTSENLGSLLREPTGCGEQNMIGFAPDVFVYLYLKKSRYLDEKTKKKAYQHIISGFQNQLNYKRSDGSFSAFGNRDESGSVWLTSFVAKCFMFASLVRPELKSQLHQHIIQAFQFIQEQQNKDGSFNEPGKVIHKDMQGGVNNRLTLAAYILISFTENKFSLDEEMINKTRLFVESQVDAVSDDPYSLAILAYALQISGSSKTQQVLNLLEDFSNDQGDL